MGKETMVRAMARLATLGEAIRLGKEGKVVTFPVNEAALAFRIPEENFKKLELDGQEIVILTTKKGEVVTALRTGETGRRQAYILLHEIILGARDGTADDILGGVEKIPPLVNEILGENLPVLREHGRLDEQDLQFLHFKLFVLGESLTDKSGLPPVENLFPTQFL